jgi:hypothetical protein
MKEAPMGVIVIKATVECDGCGQRFRSDLDPGDNRPPNWTWHDLVEDAVRGGNQSEAMNGTSIGLTSVQGEHMLCPKCTRTVDAAFPDDDHKCSREEVERTLNNAAGV